MALFRSISSVPLMGFLTSPHYASHSCFIKPALLTKLGKVNSLNNFSIWVNNYKRFLFGFTHSISYILWTGFSFKWMNFVAPIKRATKPSFTRTISHVIFLSTQKQMGRINARRIVAMVAYKKALVEWAKFMFVHHTMSKSFKSALPWSAISKLHHAISVSVFRACPNPTGISFDNRFYESFFQGCFLTHKPIYSGV